MNQKKLFWFAIVLVVCNDAIFGARFHLKQFEVKSDAYHNQHVEKSDAYHVKQLQKFDEYIEEEKRSVILLGLALLSVGVDIYQRTDKCKSVTPNLRKYVDQYETKRSEYENLRNQVNLDWNGVVNVRGFVERISASLTILSNQMQDYFNIQYNIFSALDPDYTNKINAAETNLLQKYKAVNNIPYDVYIEAYKKASAFSVQLLTTTTGATGIATHLYTSQITQAVKAVVKPYIANGKAWLSGLNPKLRWRIQHNVATRLSVTSFIASTITGVFILVTAANIFWSVWSYRKNCIEYEQKSKAAYDKINSAVEKLKLIRLDIAALKLNATNAYNSYIKVLGSTTMINGVGNLIEYTKGSNIESTMKTKVINILTDFKTNVASNLKTMTVREQLLQDITSIALPNILKNSRCVSEKLKVIATMRARCGIGMKNLDSLYSMMKESYDSSKYKCNILQPLNKNAVIKAVQDNLALFNKSSDCILNNDNLVTDICAKQGHTNQEIASLLQQSVSDVTKIIATCSQVSVPLPSGLIQICSKKREGKTTASQITNIFNYWISSEVSNIFAACELTAAQKEVICLIRGKGLAVVQQKYIQYSPSIVQAVFNACPKVMSPTDRFIICMLKSAVSLNTINTDANFAELRNRYTGTDQVAQTYNSCP